MHKRVSVNAMWARLVYAVIRVSLAAGIILAACFAIVEEELTIAMQTPVSA